MDYGPIRIASSIISTSCTCTCTSCIYCCTCITLEAAKHVLQFLGCSFPGGTRGETGKDLEGQMFAAAAIDIEPEDIHILKVCGV